MDIEKQRLIELMVDDYRIELEALSLPEVKANYEAILATKALSPQDWQALMKGNREH